MGYRLHQTRECPLCRHNVPRSSFEDHYSGHFKKRKPTAAQPAVPAGEVTARLADPNVSADLRTVELL